MRPLKRRIPSDRWVLDEQRTAEHSAENAAVTMVLRPGKRRWLDVALVVDDSRSSLIWHPLIKTLFRLLSYHGAFRDVRLWKLSSMHGELRLFPGLRPDPDGAGHRVESLIDPRGERLILLISDCVSDAWYGGSIAHVIQTWSKRSPVALIQLLPERLWRYTALRDAVPVRVQAPHPGAINSQLRAVERLRMHGQSLESNTTSHIALPIIRLHTEGSTSMASWAKMLAGARTEWAGGLLLPVYEECPTVQKVNANPPLTIKQKIDRFLAIASPEAVELATLLAAVPVTLEIASILIQELLSEKGTNWGHLAEVILSGLLEEMPHARSFETAQYDFIPEARELLRTGLPVAMGNRVISASWYRCSTL